MKNIILNGSTYKDMALNGCASLKANYKTVDALNVFPVPDGDTGINMKMTIESGINDIINNNSESIAEVSKALSRGMLMGARGNSGVILSQFFRGVSKGLEGFEIVSVKEFGDAFQAGVNQAYKAVMKPVEGTILTVQREATAYANSQINENMTIIEYFEAFLKEANESLKRTPDLLPCLKEANVVDSGATGFIYIIEGMYKALKGEYIHVADQTSSQGPTVSYSKNDFNADSELTFGYCTEFILQLQNKKVDIPTFDPQVIIDFMLSIGDSLVCVKDDDIVKVHVHTKTPYKVLEFGQQFGEFITIKIENMQIQHHESQEVQQQCNCPECVAARQSQEFKKWAVVGVASGDGLVNTFYEMGCDYVVSGGQTMNPSSEDFINGFDALNAENILVFPNNSNIIMAANQAADIYEKAHVVVIPTKSIAQGYSSLAMLDLSSDDEETIVSSLEEIISNVTTGLVTYSIREAEIDGIVIHKDDMMSLVNNKIVGTSDSIVGATKKIIDTGLTEEKEIVTIIVGEGTTEEMVNELIDYISEVRPDVEVETIQGNQSVYYFILSIE